MLANASPGQVVARFKRSGERSHSKGGRASAWRTQIDPDG